MEIFDIVNEKDEVVGQADRDKCHSDPNLIHRTAHFTLLDRKSGKVLLTQRALGLKTDPGKLCFVGEHILAGESFIQAVRRGVKEELGFKPEQFKEVNHRLIRFPNQTEFARFFVVDWGGEQINYDQEEIIKVMWVKPETLIREAKESLDYSEIARYWVEKTNWKEALL